MRYTVRENLRAARLRSGLTQAQLADRSGTSRVTIARFEAGSGRDIRVGTLASLCRALDLDLTAAPKQALPALETRLARERERARRLDRQLCHVRIAARLLEAPGRKGERLVERARDVVDLWERERLCSRHYITRWRRLLDGSPGRVARQLLEPGEWRDALFQSSPWSFAFEPTS